MTIERFECVAVYEQPGYTYAAMKACEAGGYVTYESHAEKVRGLEARLAALESMQKQDFFYHAKPLMKKCFDAAAEKLMTDIKGIATTSYPVNICHKSVAEAIDRLNDAKVSVGYQVQHSGEDEYAYCQFLNANDAPRVFITDAFITDAKIRRAMDVAFNGGFMTRHVIVTPDNVSEAVAEQPEVFAKCIYSNTDVFTFGQLYPMDGDKIAGDNFVSDLDEPDYWATSKVPLSLNAFMVLDLQGGKHAYFVKCPE